MFASLAIMFALLVPMVGAASAAVADDLECLPEQAQNATAAPHTIDCYVLNSVDIAKTIRFERSGDADGFSPLTPDFTDNVGLIAQEFGDDAGNDDVEYSWATFTSATVQTELITAWVDDDSDISTLDFDTAEGRDEAVTPGTVTPEPDETEVVEKTWFMAAPANLSIDCDDESGDDTQTNPAGQAELYTCHAFSDTNNNSAQDGGEPNVAALAIDAENLNGANDPDNSAAAGTADFNDACTTQANGSCTFSLAPSESQIGAADVCFWADVDTDTTFAPAGGVYDGGGCAEVVGAAENADETDKVTKTWAAVGVTPVVLDASPEVDNNPVNTQHTITAVVLDAFDTPVSNVQVDFEITGASRNIALGVICDNVLTNASGVATCQYTDAGLAAVPGTDTIEVYEDGSSDGEARETEDGDLSDTVAKYWTPGGPPAAASTVIDLSSAGASGGAADCGPVDDVESEAVGNVQPICGDVLSSAPAAIPGASATFTTDIGFFTNAAGTTDLGQSFTTTTDENGEAFAWVKSTESGDATVTLTSGTASDSGTLTWTPLLGRNIDCSPDTAENPTGTQHIIDCLVTDIYGNPSTNAGDEVNFTETGPGRIDSDTSPLIADNGTVEVILETVAGEEGVQLLTAEIDDDTGEVDGPADLDDDCDQPAGTPAGSPAGNCEETVEKTWTDEPTGDDHSRSLTINKMRHVKEGGKRKLLVKGSLSADDGFTACASGQTVRLQKRVGGSWFTKKTDTTGAGGGAKFLVSDAQGKYRLVAPQSSSGSDTCLKATSNSKKHQH